MTLYIVVIIEERPWLLMYFLSPCTLLDTSTVSCQIIEWHLSIAELQCTLRNNIKHKWHWINNTQFKNKERYFRTTSKLALTI